MKTYIVEYQMKGRMAMQVEAESEDEALEKAWDGLTIENVKDWAALGDGTAELLFDDEATLD